MKWLLGGIAAYLAYRWWEERQAGASGDVIPIEPSELPASEGGGFISTMGVGSGAAAPPPTPSSVPNVNQPAPVPLPPGPAPSPGIAPPGRSSSGVITLRPGTAAFFDPYHPAGSTMRGGIGRI